MDDERLEALMMRSERTRRLTAIIEGFAGELAAGEFPTAAKGRAVAERVPTLVEMRAVTASGRPAPPWEYAWLCGLDDHMGRVIAALELMESSEDGELRAGCAEYLTAVGAAVAALRAAGEAFDSVSGVGRLLPEDIEEVAAAREMRALRG